MVCRIESGERIAGITADVVVRLARALRCPIGELFGESQVVIDLDDEGVAAVIAARAAKRQAKRRR